MFCFDDCDLKHLIDILEHFLFLIFGYSPHGNLSKLGAIVTNGSWHILRQINFNET